LQVKCEKYWGDNVGSNFETSDNRLTITTTAMMSFAEYEIRMFTVKSVSETFHSLCEYMMSSL